MSAKTRGAAIAFPLLQVVAPPSLLPPLLSLSAAKPTDASKQAGRGELKLWEQQPLAPALPPLVRKERKSAFTLDQ